MNTGYFWNKAQIKPMNFQTLINKIENKNGE